MVEFSNIDSSEMSPSDWLKISEITNYYLRDPKISGVVIVHGTDTMAQGVYFLDLTTNSHKPVVFTGSMKVYTDNGFDGMSNLYNATAQAGSKKAHNWGATINFNQYVHSARYVYIYHSDNRQSFSSGEKGYLGYVNKDKVFKINSRLNKVYIAPPKELTAKVVLVRTFPGDDGAFIYEAIKAGVKGMVVEGFGAGNVNLPVSKAIKQAISKKIPVIITTQVPYGGVWPVYGSGGGAATLQKMGAILGGDLSGEKVRLLLMLILSSKDTPKKCYDRKCLGKYFVER